MPFPVAYYNIGRGYIFLFFAPSMYWELVTIIMIPRLRLRTPSDFLLSRILSENSKNASSSVGCTSSNCCYFANLCYPKHSVRGIIIQIKRHLGRIKRESFSIKLVAPAPRPRTNRSQITYIRQAAMLLCELP